MTCASCVRRVEKGLEKVPGVTGVSVNLATERATVAYDSAVVDFGQLTDAVEKAGYKVGALPVAAAPSASAAAPAPEPVDKRALARDHEIAELKRKSLVSLIIGVAMMVLMFAPRPLRYRDARPRTPVADRRHDRPVLGGWRLLPGRMGRRQAWWHQHEHAVAVGTSAAYGYSAFVTLWPELSARWGFEFHLYYESAVIIIALILMGRWLEARAKKRTGEAIKALMGLQAKTARVIRDGTSRMSPLIRWWSATWSVSAPARRYPLMALSPRAARRSTRAC
jgi:Cu+-exporting ATPase